MERRTTDLGEDGIKGGGIEQKRIKEEELMETDSSW